TRNGSFTCNPARTRIMSTLARTAVPDRHQTRRSSFVPSVMRLPVNVSARVLGNDRPMQCKLACACGGGCPGCKEEHDELIAQPKLAISTPDDPLEREADRVADMVLRMPTSRGQGGWTMSAEATRPIQRMCDSSPSADGSAASDSLASVGSGAALDRATRD